MVRPLAQLKRLGAGLLLATSLAAPVAAEIPARKGWAIHASTKDYQTLLADLKAAVKAQNMGVVTEAGPTGAAAARGMLTSPGQQD